MANLRKYFVPDQDDAIELPSSLTTDQARDVLQHSLGFGSVAAARAVNNSDGSVTFQRAGGTTKG